MAVVIQAWGSVGRGVLMVDRAELFRRIGVVTTAIYLPTGLAWITGPGDLIVFNLIWRKSERPNKKTG